MAISTIGSNSISGLGYGFKNRIINGAMVINQRGAVDTPVTPDNNFVASDRWGAINTLTSKFTLQQSSTAPAGFKYSLLTTSSSAYSVGSGDTFGISQNIEGFNVADFGWGAVGAATITLSFWVRSSLTGSFGGALANSAADRSYPFTYTISSANTWEQKTITIAGDTSGTWLTTNGIGIRVRFGLGSGSTFSGTSGSWQAGNFVQPTGTVSIVGTNGATFYITGVQLEKGNVATSFDYRPYGTELALCQRYLPAYSFAGGANPYMGAAGMASSSSTAYFGLQFPVQTRVPPTGMTVSAASHFAAFLVTTGTSNATGVTFGGANNQSAFIYLTGMTGLTAGNSTLIYMSNSSALMTFTGCEL